MNATMKSRWPSGLASAVVLGLVAFAIFGPLLNLFLWAFAEQWYFPHKLPQQFGFTFWARVFQPRGNALASLATSIWIALLTVVTSLAVAIPAGYALARLKLRWRGLILLAFLLPQAVPNIPVYVNIARIFYEIGLNGTVLGVVLVHAAHGLVLAVWIASAAFIVYGTTIPFNFVHDRRLVVEHIERLTWNPLIAADIGRGFAQHGGVTVDVLSHRDIAACAAGAHRQRDFRVPRVARRIHRHVFRRRAGCHDAAAPHVQCQHGRQLPDCFDHGAAAADSVYRLHAGRRALPEGRCARDGGAVAPRLFAVRV